jgi:hypothetical protein
MPPIIILTGNNRDSDGNVVYKLGGLAVQNLLLVVDKMNVTVVFRKPVLSLEMEGGLREGGNLAAGLSNVAIGALLLVAALVSSTFQTTIPYGFHAIQCFVPCPQTVEIMENIMTYKLPVWLTMATVFILIAILWWSIANWRHSYLKNSRTNQTLSDCLHNAWAVAMGVSVTNIPSYWDFRIIFLVYVCYCFARSTVFQAFFTSYLVEPGYGKKLLTNC